MGTALNWRTAVEKGRTELYFIFILAERPLWPGTPVEGSAQSARLHDCTGFES